MIKTISKKIGIRLFLEGIESPVISVSVTSAMNTPASAHIIVPDNDSAFRILPRTVVHVFFYVGTNSTYFPTDSNYGKAPSARRSSSKQYKLMFSGEIFSVFHSKSSHGQRNLTFMCMDFSNILDTTYTYQVGFSQSSGILGTGAAANAQFMSANTINNNPFDDLINSPQMVISEMVTRQASHPTHNQRKSALGGLLKILELLLGIQGSSMGINIWTTIHERRVRLMDQIASDDGDVAEKLFTDSVFQQWVTNSIGQSNPAMSFREIVMMIMQYIFYGMTPVPCAAYFSPKGVDKKTGKKLTGRERPVYPVDTQISGTLPKNTHKYFSDRSLGPKGEIADARRTDVDVLNTAILLCQELEKDVASKVPWVGNKKLSGPRITDTWRSESERIALYGYDKHGNLRGATSPHTLGIAADIAWTVYPQWAAEGLSIKVGNICMSTSAKGLRGYLASASSNNLAELAVLKSTPLYLSGQVTDGTDKKQVNKMRIINKALTRRSTSSYHMDVLKALNSKLKDGITEARIVDAVCNTGNTKYNGTYYMPQQRAAKLAATDFFYLHHCKKKKLQHQWWRGIHTAFMVTASGGIFDTTHNTKKLNPFSSNYKPAMNPEQVMKRWGVSPADYADDFAFLRCFSRDWYDTHAMVQNDALAKWMHIRAVCLWKLLKRKKIKEDHPIFKNNIKGKSWDLSKFDWDTCTFGQVYMHAGGEVNYTDTAGNLVKYKNYAPWIDLDFHAALCAMESFVLSAWITGYKEMGKKIGPVTKALGLEGRIVWGGRPTFDVGFDCNLLKYFGMGNDVVHIQKSKKKNIKKSAAKPTAQGLIESKVTKKSERERLVHHIMRPDIWMCAPPKCNVIFPSDISTINVSREMMRQTSRVFLLTFNEIYGQDAIFNNHFFAPQFADPDAQNIEAIAFGNATNSVLYPHEVHSGIVPKVERLSEVAFYSRTVSTELQEGEDVGFIKSEQITQSDLDGITTEAEYASTIEAKVGGGGGENFKNTVHTYAGRVAHFTLLKHRFMSTRLTLNCKFLPRIVGGLPCLVIGRTKHEEGGYSDNYNWLGMIENVSHTASSQGGNTSISISHARVAGQGDDTIDELMQNVSDTNNQLFTITDQSITRLREASSAIVEFDGIRITDKPTTVDEAFVSFMMDNWEKYVISPFAQTPAGVKPMYPESQSVPSLSPSSTNRRLNNDRIANVGIRTQLASYTAGGSTLSAPAPNLKAIAMHVWKTRQEFPDGLFDPASYSDSAQVFKGGNIKEGIGDTAVDSPFKTYATAIREDEYDRAVFHYMPKLCFGIVEMYYVGYTGAGSYNFNAWTGGYIAELETLGHRTTPVPAQGTPSTVYYDGNGTKRYRHWSDPSAMAASIQQGARMQEYTAAVASVIDSTAVFKAEFNLAWSLASSYTADGDRADSYLDLEEPYINHPIAVKGRTGSGGYRNMPWHNILISRLLNMEGKYAQPFPYRGIYREEKATEAYFKVVDEAAASMTLKITEDMLKAAASFQIDVKGVQKTITEITPKPGTSIADYYFITYTQKVTASTPSEPLTIDDVISQLPTELPWTQKGIKAAKGTTVISRADAPRIKILIEKDDTGGGDLNLRTVPMSATIKIQIPVMLPCGAYQVRMGVPVGATATSSTDVLPLEEALMPPWFSDDYFNENIGKLYRGWVGCDSIIDDVAAPEKGVTSKSIKQAIEKIESIWNAASFDDQDAIAETYGKRNHATVADVLGNIADQKDKSGPHLTGGFHSAAVGDFSQLEYLDLVGVNLSNNSGQGSFTLDMKSANLSASKIDPRVSRRKMVEYYIKSVTGRGKRG